MSSQLSQDLSNRFSPNYSYVFNFEQRFDYTMSQKWMSDKWHTAFYWVALYMVVVFGGQSLMTSRDAYKLRKTLALWNVLLALFSILGTFRTLPEMVHVLKEFGFSHSVCSPSYVEEVKVSGYWTWLFALSKVPELGLYSSLTYSNELTIQSMNRRHDIHSVAKAVTAIPPLLPSHNCLIIHVVFIFGAHIDRQVVYKHELFGPLVDVQLLRDPCLWLSYTEENSNDYHFVTNHTNDNRGVRHILRV
jgi:hypothetical protein